MPTFRVWTEPKCPKCGGAVEQRTRELRLAGGVLALVRFTVCRSRECRAWRPEVVSA